ncbi:MAG TPA: hypothetical protein VGC65_00345 [Bacteroidia bacterium]|jgi:hypothetical protein
MKTVILQATPPAECAYCKKVEELRPYGKDGAKICFDCGMLPENKAETERLLQARLEKGDINIEDN